VGVKAKELLHMAYPEDPKGFRRGQPTGAHFPPDDRRGDEFRQPARQEQRNGARQGQQGGKQQAAFSAYRPEAYANNGKSGGRSDGAEWQQQAQSVPQFRAEPAAPQRPAPEPYRPAPAPIADRGRDPYYNGANDPYDTGTRDFDANWRSTDYQEPPAEPFAPPSYYQQDEPNHADVQSTHDRFFAAEPEPPRVVAPPPAPPAGRYRQPQSDFEEDFHEEPRPAPRAPAPAAASRGFDEAGGDYRWDNFDQQPAPESVRPFPNAKLDVPGEEDLDADYFDDEFEGDEDFVEQKKGGKKLMAAVLVGAVVTGGGLAYLYKSQAGGNGTGEPPIMTADSRPIKEKPTDPGGRDFPNGSKLIYDRLDNGGGTPEGPTRVAAREEQTTTGDVVGVVTTGGNGTLEERIQNALRDAKKQDDPPATAAANSVSSLDTPRPVRTEIFRPDGSVDQSRVQRRQAPADNDAPVANAPRGVVSREAPQAPAAAPAPRAQIAAATPAPAAIAPAGGGESGMFVQIAARNDQAAAMAAFADLQQKYAAVLGNHSPSVRKVDLGEKGVWYRLMVGPMPNKADADKLCEDLKTAGMKSCFSRKE
jgi:cell division protein FtsN